MFPISDDNPQPGQPIVTWTIIAACIGVFLWEMSLPAGEAERAILQLGAVPASLFGAAGAGPIHAWATIFTSMFMHASIGHVAGNMLYLWIFGDNIELAMGRVRFLVFYLLCGAAAALTQSLQAPESTIPLVGASGAISGVLGAYLLLYPFGRVRVLFMPLPLFVRVITVPSLVVLGFWFVIQFLSGLSSASDGGGVAFWAHVGGFLAGMVLMPFFKRRDVPLFQRETPRVFDTRRAKGEGSERRGPWG